MWVRAAALLVLLLASAPYAAAQPPTVGAMADAVAEAHAKSPEAFAQALAQRGLDPWLVAEELLATNRRSIAEAVASVDPSSLRTKELGAYVAWRVKHPRATDVAKLADEITTAFAAQRAAERCADAAIGYPPPGAAGVLQSLLPA